MQTFFLLFPPDFFPALILGLISGAGFKLWKYAKGSCLLMPIFWYVYGAWLFSCFIVLFSHAVMLNGFFVGLGLAFIKPLLGLFARVYERLAEFQRERAYQRQQQKHQNEQTPPHQEQTQQQKDTERTRREREAEAERQQRQKQQEQTQKKTHQEQPKPPPQKEELDTRTPEQILGLASGWTQDDLLKAYRRESQRLHPDKWTGKPPIIYAEMEKEFKKVQWAYNKLKIL